MSASSVRQWNCLGAHAWMVNGCGAKVVHQRHHVGGSVANCRWLDELIFSHPLLHQRKYIVGSRRCSAAPALVCHVQQS